MADAATQPAWEAVIGLETHVQLGTDSKIFTAASTTFGDDPNTHIDPVVCGLPGTLPVLNQKVLEYAVKAAMALNLNIAEHSKFDRKQYFYPDLPKNYQISQYDEPIAEEGWIEVEVAEKGKDTYLKTIGIERLHMEEDAGKLVHAGSDRLAGSTHSLVDYNRAGVISIFHYRNHGADVGRIVVGVLVPEQEKEGWTDFLDALGYRHWDETNNPAYGLFL